MARRRGPGGAGDTGGAAVPDAGAEVARPCDPVELALAQLQAIVEHAPVGIILSVGGRRVLANGRAQELTGRSEQQLLDDGLAPVIGDDLRGAYDEALAELAAGRPGSYVVPVRTAGDGTRRLEVAVFPVRVDGEPVGGVAMLRDVTEELADRQMLQRFEALAHATSDLVGMVTPQADLLYLNPAGRAIAGLPSEGPAVGWDLFSIVPPDQQPVLIVDAYAALVRGEVWQGEIDLVAADGRRFPVSTVAVGLRNDEGELDALAVIHRDLSDRKQLERGLAHAASHDALTGLPNRDHLFDLLTDRLAQRHPVGVLFLDLDDFKVVNDSLGHVIGDGVLRTVAERLASACRVGDVVGRIGGDEFLVVCPGLASDAEARAIAARILDRLAVPIEVSGRQLVIGAAVGIALARPGLASADELVQDADIAMYRAKRSGRRQMAVFQEAMRSELVDRLELERDLRRALAQDELDLRFQPIVHLQDGAIWGFEALLRWHHPERGELAPGTFLSIADDTGLATPIGEWVVERALAAGAHLRTVVPNLRIAVNVSPGQLMQPDLPGLVARHAGHHGVAASMLVVEVTEHALMLDVERAQDRLGELRALGVGLSLDDFGTGYSSLALLRRLSLDMVKIDQSFVAGLGREPGDTQIVRLVLSLATELGLTAVAEGVETVLHEQELIRLGCGLAQGFRYAPPLELAEAFALLQQAPESLRR